MYELPTSLNEELLEEVRLSGDSDQYEFIDEYDPFAAEVKIHDLLLNSPFRTMNINDAHYFYVPVYFSTILYNMAYTEVGRMVRF